MNMSADITPSTTPNQPYAILRIKRKRNEEPLDALVVEGMRRKRSRGIGVFHYAETVEDGVWDDAERQQGIQEKISRLSKETKKAVPAATQPKDLRSSPEKVRRYTVVDRNEAKPFPPAAPLKNLYTKEPHKSSKEFKLYDAIPAEQAPIYQNAMSDEMDKFLPLLNDYLRIHDISASSNVLTPAANRPSDDWVWDVFYHRPATLSEWNNIAANVGTLTGLPAESEGYDSLSDSDEEYIDEADEDSNAEEYYKNDYPEEDDGDEFHENSDHERDLHTDDDFY